MKFKTRMINAAVAAALGTVAGAAQAVNLGSDGEGQVLIYPYYTAQAKSIPGGGTGQFNTLITIVNSDSVNGKAVKVRFIEGKASREVLDFNLYLSPNDMWTGVVATCASVGGPNNCTVIGGPMLQTTDNSCTAPEIPAITGVTGVTTSGVTRQIAFVNYLYSGVNKDAWNDQTLVPRAMEGYVEVIQMADFAPNTSTYKWALHGQTTQVPANCFAIRNGWLPTANPSFYTSASFDMNIPTGHLSGAETLINVGEGTDASVDAVALDVFSIIQNHQAPGTVQPDLSTVNPAISSVLDGNRLPIGFQPSFIQTNWTGAAAVAPVSAVLQRNQVINEYVIYGAPVGFQTDHVLTFPTKRLHQSSTGSIAPFTATLAQNASGICEPVTLTFYNRDESIQSSQPGFSPPPPSQTNQLCYETNVVSIANGANTSNVLGSQNLRITATSIFPEGWTRYGFGNVNTTTSLTQLMVSPGNSQFVSLVTGASATLGAGVTYVGLPVVGFFIEDFVNTSNLTSFATAYASRYTRSIFPQP